MFEKVPSATGSHKLGQHMIWCIKIWTLCLFYNQSIDVAPTTFLFSLSTEFISQEVCCLYVQYIQCIKYSSNVSNIFHTLHTFNTLCHQRIYFGHLIVMFPLLNFFLPPYQSTDKQKYTNRCKIHTRYNTNNKHKTNHVYKCIRHINKACETYKYTLIIYIYIYIQNITWRAPRRRTGLPPPGIVVSTSGIVRWE